MENASDALKMAGAVLLFVIALSVSIMVFSDAREASTSILTHADNIRTYYDIKVPISEREVQVDAVIAKLYTCYQTQDTVLFYKGTKSSKGKILKIQPVTLYYTEAQDKKEGVETIPVNKYSGLITSGTARGVYGIDLTDERARDEPWKSDYPAQKAFLDSLINRKLTNWYIYSRTLETCSNEKSLTEKNQYRINFVYNFDGSYSSLLNCKGKFIERVGIYNSNAVVDKKTNAKGEDEFSYSGTNTSSSEIAFNEIDETIENPEGNQKRIIQYIYIGE